MKRSRLILWLLGVLTLGTVLRLMWIYYVNTQPIYDFKRYHDLAMSLLNHGTYEMPEGLDYLKADTPYIRTGVHYPTAFRPPGYPFFLTALYAFYPSILAAKLANVVFGGIWIICMYLLGHKYISVKAGLWAAFLTAVFPPAIAYTSVLSAEIISVAVLLVILCVQAYRVGNIWVRNVVLGLLMGFLALIKPYFIVFPVLYAVLLWWQYRESDKRNVDAEKTDNARIGSYVAAKHLKTTALSVLIAGIAMAAVISPWTIRNYNTFDRFVPISTNGDFVLYINNNDLNTGKYMDALKVPGSIFNTDRILNANGQYNEADAMKVARAEAMKWIKSHPKEAFFLGLTRVTISYASVGTEIYEWTMSEAQLRFDRFWITPFVNVSRLTGLLAVGGGLLYLVLVLVHFVRFRRLAGLHAMNLLFGLFFTAVIFASEGQPRYTFTLFPFLLLGVVWLGARVPGLLKAEEAQTEN